MAELRVMYEDEDVVVMKAPTDEELEVLVKDIIKKKNRPMTWKELREVFSGTAGEDRLRKVLIRLMLARVLFSILILLVIIQGILKGNLVLIVLLASLRFQFIF